MELSIQNITESKADNKNDTGNAVKKTQLSTDAPPPVNSKRKRKRKGNKTARPDTLLTPSPSTSTSQPDLPQHPSINSVVVRQLNPSEELAVAPAVVHDTVEQETCIKTVEKKAKKGRNSKKKSTAEQRISQTTQGAIAPENSIPQSKKLQKWISPKPGRFGVPAGLQPMHFIRQSPAANQESPKQEKFSCYWSNKEVESGLASGLLISGIIRINPRNYQKSYITPADDEDAKDVLIDGIMDRNRALEGDEVAVKLYDESKWQVEESIDGDPVIQKTGLVVAILVKHHNRRTVGYLKLVQKTSKCTKKKTGQGESKIATTGSQGQEQPTNGSCHQKMENPQQILASISAAGLLESPNGLADSNVEAFKFPDMVLFSPRDARMPRMWVKTSSLPSGTPSNLNPSNCQNHLFLACIQEWNGLPIANGNLLAYIGEADEVDTETTALLLEHDLDVTPYPENLFTLPPLPFEIPQKELNERLDLRRNCIFTIDPVTAKDLDDALSVREIGEGLLEVGVHIADPTFFLEEGSPLDLCVRHRATSIYLVQNVFHMLPKDLCSICSLLPGEDKLAFSLIMEVDTKSWKVLTHKFSRSIINSCAQLSYEHAQAFIDDPGRNWSSKDFPDVHNGFTIGDLCHAVNLMRPFSAALREKRFTFSGCEINDDECGFQGGALKINQPKLCFNLDHSTSMPKEVFVYENKESHRLIEELMLMANILTAQRLATLFPKHAFLRRHCKPKMKLLNNLAQELTLYGIHLDTSAAGALNASLKRYGPIDPEDQGIPPFKPCDILDGNVSSSNPGLHKTEKISYDFEMIPNLLRDSNGQRCQLPAKEKKMNNMSDITELQQEACLEKEVGTETLPVVADLEESLNNLVVWDGKIECKVEKQSEEQEINAGSCVHLCSAGSDVFESESENIKKSEKNKKAFFRNELSSPMKNSPSEKELALARGLVLNHLCAKPMVRADYYCLGASVESTSNKNIRWKLVEDVSGDEEELKVDTHHYALNIPLYTHFTSPIRRYADIMVHRLLAASLGYAPPPQSNPLELQKIATNCNKKNTGAKRASEASNELFFRLWVRLQVEQDNSREKEVVFPVVDGVQNADPDESRSEGGLRETAVVVNAKDYSFDAILLRFGVLVRVYVNKLPANVRSNKRLGTNTISIRWFLPGKNAATRESPVQDIAMFSLVDLLIYYSYSARRVRAELLSPFNCLDTSP